MPIVLVAIVVPGMNGIAGTVVVPVCPMGWAGIVPEGVKKGGACCEVDVPNRFSNPGGITPNFPAP